MASVYREVHIQASADKVWAALRDVGALHTRLCPGFVINTEMDGDDARWVTFGNGMKLREVILSVDETTRRVAWAIIGGQLAHYNGAAQVTALDDGTCRFTWVSDVLPNESAPTVASMIDNGIATIKRTQETA